MPYKVIHEKCGNILYEGNDILSPQDVLMYYKKCPSCGELLHLDKISGQNVDSVMLMHEDIIVKSVSEGIDGLLLILTNMGNTPYKSVLRELLEDAKWNYIEWYKANNKPIPKEEIERARKVCEYITSQLKISGEEMRIYIQRFKERVYKRRYRQRPYVKERMRDYMRRYRQRLKERASLTK